jgi:hypothetical protein
MRFRFPRAVIAALLVGGGLWAGIQAAPIARADLGCVVDPAEVAIDPIEGDLLREINQYRAEQGLGAVELSSLLTQAAVWKSAARVNGGPETHDDPGRHWDARLNDCGYDFNASKGENLARLEGEIPPTIEAHAIVQAWKNSPAHNAVLTEPVFRDIGIARIRSGTITYWTADFGSVSDSEGVHSAAKLAGSNTTAGAPADVTCNADDPDAEC